VKVKPGNRGAAVISVLNILVFTAIDILAHRERKQKKRLGEVSPASAALDSPITGIAGKDENDFGAAVQTVEIQKL
jgi:hypothetical protein